MNCNCKSIEKIRRAGIASLRQSFEESALLSLRVNGKLFDQFVAEQIEAMDQTPEQIKRDQKRCRLLLPIQPTEDELRMWPFLQNHGGIGTPGRHPIFIHYCDVFTQKKLWESSLETLEKIKENVADYDKRAGEAKEKIESALRVLNALEWISEVSKRETMISMDNIYMDDLLKTGRYYCYPKDEK